MLQELKQKLLHEAPVSSAVTSVSLILIFPFVQVAAKDLEKHMNDKIGNHLTAIYFDQDKKVKQLTLEKQEQWEKIELLRKKLDDAYSVMDNKVKELVLAKNEQDKKIEILTKDRDQWKQATENLKKDYDEKLRDLLLEKRVQGQQIKTLTTELDNLKRNHDMRTDVLWQMCKRLESSKK